MFKSIVLALALAVSLPIASTAFAADFKSPQPTDQSSLDARQLAHNDAIGSSFELDRRTEDRVEAAKAHFAVAQELAASGKLSLAKTEFDKAQELAPGLPFASLALVESLDRKISPPRVVALAVPPSRAPLAEPLPTLSPTPASVSPIAVVAPFVEAEAKKETPAKAAEQPEGWLDRLQVIIGALLSMALLGCAWYLSRNAGQHGELPDRLRLLMGLPKARVDAQNAADPEDANLEAAEQVSAQSDDAAVDRFAVALKHRLAQARRQGHGGWRDALLFPPETLAHSLMQHAQQGDTVGVAGYAMMLHQRGHTLFVSPALEQAAVPPAPASAHQDQIPGSTSSSQAV